MTNEPRVAVFPGSFDPITRGHQDIIARALGLVDRVIVAVGHQPSQPKRGLFTVAERVEMIRELYRDSPAVAVADFEGLLVDFAREKGARWILRAVRGATDLEYEFQMARMNRSLDPSLETVFLVPAAETGFISSSLVRQIAGLGGDVAPFVSAPILRRLLDRS